MHRHARVAGVWGGLLLVTVVHAADRLTLAEAYRLAFQYVERIAIADAEVARTRLGAYRALSTVAPNVTFTGTYTREKEELTFVSVAPAQPVPGVAPGTSRSLYEFLSSPDAPAVTAWLRRELPRCMALVPGARNKTFLRGIYRWCVAEGNDLLAR